MVSRMKEMTPDWELTMARSRAGWSAESTSLDASSRDRQALTMTKFEIGPPVRTGLDPCQRMNRDDRVTVTNDHRGPVRREVARMSNNSEMTDPADDQPRSAPSNKKLSPGGHLTVSHSRACGPEYRLNRAQTSSNSSPGSPQKVLNYEQFEQAISPPRAQRYLRATIDPVTGNDDPSAAIALYEQNSRLSAQIWGTIADVEVVLRNIIASAVSEHHTALRPDPMLRWYDEPSWFRTGKELTTKTVKSLAIAKRRINDPGPESGSTRPSEGRLVAELTLGFWRYLLIARYEHSLWNPAIRSRFPSLGHLSGSESRRQVHDRVEKLNYLRNRVAHHEPIYEPFTIPGHQQAIDPMKVLVDAVEMISWNDPRVAEWISSRSDLWS